MAACSFMGLPWYVAATVISIAHIESLKMESETSAPGEQPQFLGVRSDGPDVDLRVQLLGFLLSFLIIGVSLQGAEADGDSGVCSDRPLGLPGSNPPGEGNKHRCFYVRTRFRSPFTVLLPHQYIPMPVLYGVFLYMGVASLSGIQVGRRGRRAP